MKIESVMDVPKSTTDISTESQKPTTIRALFRQAIDEDRFRQAVVVSMLFGGFQCIDLLSVLGWLNFDKGMSYLMVLVGLLSGMTIGLGALLTNAFVLDHFSRMLYKKRASTRSIMIASGMAVFPACIGTGVFTLAGLFFFSDTFLYWPQHYSEQELIKNGWTSLIDPVSKSIGASLLLGNILALSELFEIRKRNALVLTLISGSILAIPFLPVLFLLVFADFMHK